MHSLPLLLQVAVVAVGLIVPVPGRAGDASPRDLGRVEIVRDTWGVPHVFAQTDAGAIYGLGFVTAEDRGFQMHRNRRLMQGRLAELMGEVPHARRPDETTVTHDRKVRTFGFHESAHRIAENLDADTLELLQAYCDGVNDFFARHPEPDHPLWSKFGLEPEPWTPADCLLAWWHVAQFFGPDGTRDLIAFHNLERDRRQAPPIVIDDTAAVVQPGDVAPEWVEAVDQYLIAHGFDPESSAKELRSGPADGPSFSHAWVVGGDRSTTGAATLVSDPQTPVTNPSMFYHAHIQGATFNARGLGVPGSPLILIGFNERVAWGATALGADQADLFRLQTDPERPGQYRFDGEWRPIASRTETIRVQDAPDQTITVRRTHLGPIVTEFAFAGPDDPEVALKRVPLCDTDRETIQAAFAMMRARDVAEFDQALALWRFPTANLVFGDADGGLGYRAAGAIPLRSPQAPDAGRAAHDGSASVFDWQGFIPHELMPHVLNPERGVLYSANQRPIASFYRIDLGAATGMLGDTVRSWRLSERLAAQEQFAPEDVLAIHFDAVDPALREIVRLGLHLRDRLGRELSAETAQALEHLERWYESGASTELATPGAVLATQINTMFRPPQTELTWQYGGGQSGLCRFLKTVAARLDDDPNAVIHDDEHDYIDQVLARAWHDARRQFGDDPDRWLEQAREDLARVRLGYFEGLDGFASLDPRFDVATPPLRCLHGNTMFCQRSQAYTQFVPLHDPDQARALMPIGSSDNPDSPDHARLMPLWASSELHPAPLSREAIEPFQNSYKILIE